MITLLGWAQIAEAASEGQMTFKRIPTQYIAALGDPTATSGNNAHTWGLWRKDPGPRGVRLKNFELLLADGGVAPAQWLFDSSDWWLEENGLIMEPPEFPISAGKYIVTGDREAVALLTIHPASNDGTQAWELDRGTTLHDVTHLACRSARYTPDTTTQSCSPGKAPQSAFRIKPGADMPPVEGCDKQDYAVLFIVALPAEK